jgi:hypothetical protein
MPLPPRTTSVIIAEQEEQLELRRGLCVGHDRCRAHERAIVNVIDAVSIRIATEDIKQPPDGGRICVW